MANLVVTGAVLNASSITWSLCSGVFAYPFGLILPRSGAGAGIKVDRVMGAARSSQRAW